MGLTSMSGPVYGAKQTLFSVYRHAVITAQSALEVFEIAVPTTEDWLVSRVAVYCVAAGSAAAGVDVQDDGASILTGVITATAGAPAYGVPTATGGEDEGKIVAAGSAVTVKVTTGTTTAAGELTVIVEGYRRYVGAEL